MRVRILRTCSGAVHGLDLSHYKLHLVYDLPSTLANYLIATGLARLEMRTTEHPKPPVAGERRQPGFQ